MAVIRLSNGVDVSVKLPVGEVIAALKIEEPSNGFVELPGEEGPVHVRPAGVIAVLDETPKGRAGFRYGQAAG